MTLHGTFYGLVAKDQIIEKIDQLNHKHSHKSVANNKQGLSVLKAYCHEFIGILDTCLATDLRAVKRCRAQVEKYLYEDNPERASAAMLDVYGINLNLRSIAETFVPIADFPTCKPLLELSVEDTISLANDLNKNTFTKVLASASLLGKKIGDAIAITDVMKFYKNQIEKLECEISADGDEPSPTEYFLLTKFKAELGYCHKAMFKTGIGGIKEIAGLIKTADEEIRKFEEMTRVKQGERCRDFIGIN